MIQSTLRSDSKASFTVIKKSMTTRTKQVVLSPKSLTLTPTANSKSRDKLIWNEMSYSRQAAGDKNLISCEKAAIIVMLLVT